MSLEKHSANEIRDKWLELKLIIIDLTLLVNPAQVGKNMNVTDIICHNQ